MKILSMLVKTSWEIEIELFHSALLHIKTRFCPKYFVHGCTSAKENLTLDAVEVPTR